MTSSDIASQNLPLLIACNKSDLGSSATVAKIKNQLEAEMCVNTTIKNFDMLISINSIVNQLVFDASFSCLLHRSQLIDTKGSLEDTGGGEDGTMTLRKAGEVQLLLSSLSFLCCSPSKSELSMWSADF